MPVYAVRELKPRTTIEGYSKSSMIIQRILNLHVLPRFVVDLPKQVASVGTGWHVHNAHVTD